MLGAGVRGKVLLHLLSYVAWDTEYSAPYEITIEGISEAVSVGRNTVSRELRELVRLGLVKARKCHVRGYRVKKNAFVLTAEGIALARKVFRRAMDMEVSVMVDSSWKRVPLRDTIEGVNPGPKDVLQAIKELNVGNLDLLGATE